MKKSLALFATVLAAVLNAATPSTSLVYKNTTTNALTGNIVVGNNTTISATGNGTITATALTGNITGNPTVSGNLTVSGDVLLSTNNAYIKGKTSGNSTVNLMALTTDNLTRFIAGVDAGGFQWTNQAQTAAWLALNSSGLYVTGDLSVSGGTATISGSSGHLKLTSTTASKTWDLFADNGGPFIIAHSGVVNALQINPTTGNTYVTGQLRSSSNIVASNLGSADTGFYGTAGTDAGSGHRLALVRTDTPTGGSALLSAFGAAVIEVNAATGINTGTRALTIDTSANATFAGTKTTFNSAAASTAGQRQNITSSVTAAASTVAKKVAYIGPTHSLAIRVIAVQDESTANSAVWAGNFTTAYGGTASAGTTSAVVGNITAISVAYDNGGAPNYTLNVTLTYTGNAPVIYYTIDGHSFNAMNGL